jgi:excinuclease ABC subunit A
MEGKSIAIKGAREHNLRSIDLEIPRDRLVVITGLSGSGKSSLAFDTIYAEGQRRYVESLSSYARQFLEQMAKPDVESIEGLPPTIAIEQRSGVASPRSTVATTTEIYDYLRLLYARVGIPHCHKCGRTISQQSTDEIVDQILSLKEGARLLILGPLARGRKGTHRDLFVQAKKEGFVRMRVDGEVIEIGEAPELNRYKQHNIEVVVDRLEVDPEMRSRVQDSIEIALKLGNGTAIASYDDGDEWKDLLFSELYACPVCQVSFEELAPRSFSFNSPYGACSTCGGLGTKLELDPDLVVPDKSLSLKNGAVEAWRRGGKRMIIRFARKLRKFMSDFDVDPHKPFAELDENTTRILLHGTTKDDEKQYDVKFEGVMPSLDAWFRRTASDYVKRRLLAYMSELSCPDCGGARLRPESLAVTIGGKNIQQVTAMSVEEALEFFGALKLRKTDQTIAGHILREIKSRLSFMLDVGLGYLTLDRKSGTLSGGEAERIRLATQVGSGLVGVCDVLDEPTIGLHQRDNARLLQTLCMLRDLGNTVIVVEHDDATIREADHVVDLGPGAGLEGGNLVAQGTVKDICTCRDSLTGSFLSGEMRIEVPSSRREVDMENGLEIRGAAENNLKSIDVRIPLRGMCCVTGVSGSGKSTLIDLVLYRALARRLYSSREKPGAHKEILGIENIDKVIKIDQSPIGRTPRSNPATYTKTFDDIRRLFARLKDAKIRGYKPGRFSFNTKGGRCEACQGQGTKKIEMHFLPDVFIECEECSGRRYNRETLEIRYKGKNIAEILDMTASDALSFFWNFPQLKRKIERLCGVGLGYMPLGQSSTTLSGGEAQRVKLASELGKVATGNTVYILDEPTTGLHFADISNLLDVLNSLIEKGNTVIIIEHNMDVIKCADYIIDLGPEGGEAGGTVVACGTPEHVTSNGKSYTGKILKKYLK